ncbi:MAG: TetR/AcrR family transcriptional regulator [Vulcanimicrobiaceae bacterium]
MGQKRRTRRALVEAARELLAEGLTPTVEQAAASAAVSRPTAYRYFRNQHALLVATNPELAMDSLLPEDAPQDPLKRLDFVSKALVQLILQNEVALRAMLRISLERTGGKHPALAIRTGRRIGWIEDALAPLKSELTPTRYRRLLLQISATLGIEPLVWLVDIASVERNEAGEILRASARELLMGAL